DDVQHHRLAADAAVFDIGLAAGRAIDQQADRLETVRAGYADFFLKHLATSSSIRQYLTEDRIQIIPALRAGTEPLRVGFDQPGVEGGCEPLQQCLPAQSGALLIVLASDAVPEPQSTEQE